MSILTRTIEYGHDGTTLEAFIAFDDSASPRPGVMVSHAWGGRDDFACDKARALAELGYTGFALDMYGKGVFGERVEEKQALMNPLASNRPKLQARLHAALQTFQGQDEVQSDNIAAIGFCFGGLCVLDLARSGADVKGVVSFHGILGAPDNLDGVSPKAKILACHGYDDPMATPADLVAFGNEMTARGADWQAHAYGGTSHAFTVAEANAPDMGLKYNADSDRRSWQAMQNFLGEVLD